MISGKGQVRVMGYTRYSKKMKESVVKRILSREETMADISRDTGINPNTIAKWRDNAQQKGLSITTKYKKADKWSSSDKFQVVLETANLNEIEFSEYCREKGIYPEQVKEWKEACMKANGAETEKSSEATKELKKERKEKEKLEKELQRKEKALAETAALLVLRKKANAIWGTDEEGE